MEALEVLFVYRLGGVQTDGDPVSKYSYSLIRPPLSHDMPCIVSNLSQKTDRHSSYVINDPFADCRSPFPCTLPFHAFTTHRYRYASPQIPASARPTALCHVKLSCRWIPGSTRVNTGVRSANIIAGFVIYCSDSWILYDHVM